MDAKDFYTTCLRQATEVVKQVRPDQLAGATPDDDWTVRDLLNHMLNEVVWVPDMVAGRTVAEVGDTHDGNIFASEVADSDIDLTVIWESAASKAENAVLAADADATAHLSYDDVDVKDYLRMTGGDILVHSWDLAKALGMPFSFDHAVAEHMWQAVKDNNMSGSGLFKAELPYSDDDTDHDKILAKFGRNKQWSNQYA